MFALQSPTEGRIIEYLLAQQGQPFSYRDVGATKQAQPPAGFDVDHQRVELGQGKAVFAAACAALRAWKMFPREMCRLYWPDRAIDVDVTVAVQFRAILFWSLNPARIVYTIDEQGEVQRFGFAYGTLPDHLESGEERFMVEWCREDNRVWYDLLAFSRPQHPLARIGYPLVRREQRRFRVLSGRAMQDAVAVALAN